MSINFSVTCATIIAIQEYSKCDFYMQNALYSEDARTAKLWYMKIKQTLCTSFKLCTHKYQVRKEKDEPLECIHQKQMH